VWTVLPGKRPKGNKTKRIGHYWKAPKIWTLNLLILYTGIFSIPGALVIPLQNRQWYFLHKVDEMLLLNFSVFTASFVTSECTAWKAGDGRDEKINRKIWREHTLRRPRCRWEDVKFITCYNVWGCGLDLCGAGYCLVFSFCERCHEH